MSNKQHKQHKQHEPTPLSTVLTADELSSFITGHRKGKGSPSYQAIRDDLKARKEFLCNLGQLPRLSPESVDKLPLNLSGEELTDALLSPLCQPKHQIHTNHGAWYYDGMAWLMQNYLIIGIKCDSQREGCWRDNQRLDTVDPMNWNGRLQDTTGIVLPAIDSLVIGEFKVSELLAILKPMLKFKTVLGEGWSNLVLIGHEFFEVEQIFELLQVINQLTDTVEIISYPKTSEKKSYWTYITRPGGLLIRDKQGTVVARISGLLPNKKTDRGQWQTHHCLIDLQTHQTFDLVAMAELESKAKYIKLKLSSNQQQVNNLVKDGAERLTDALHLLTDHADVLTGMDSDLPEVPNWGTAREILEGYETAYRKANFDEKNSAVADALLLLKEETGREIPNLEPLLEWLKRGQLLLTDLMVECEKYRP